MDKASHETHFVDVKTVKKSVAAAAMGNALEWFDYGVYAYVVSSLSQVFFPSDDSFSALLLSYGVGFALPFIVRPLGGLFWGPLGDRIGRNKVLATTIILMSFCTFIIGILPGYDKIGLWAPALLIIARLIQGFSTGGEYGGAATYIVESASDQHRGFMASWLEFGTLAGYVLGALVVQAVQYSLPAEAFAQWGWRIPFLLAAPLGLIGLYLRLKLEASPAFEHLEKNDDIAHSPLKAVLRHHFQELLVCFGLVILLNVAYYTVLTYLPGYLTQVLSFPSAHALLFLLLTMLLMMALVTRVGKLSDKMGRKPMILLACLGFILLSYPAFYLLMQGQMLFTILGLAILGGLVVVLSGTMPAMLPAIFPTYVRYGGFAIAYNLSTALFGGTAPMVITYLIDQTGSDFIPAYYLMAAAAIALIPLSLVKESAGKPLKGSPAIKRAV